MTDKHHYPIREDGGGFYCGTCGLSSTSEACAGPPPMPLSFYELSRIKLALEKSPFSESHTLALVNEHLNWRGCQTRIGYASHTYYNEALHEIKECLLQEFEIPYTHIEKWETQDQKPWSAKIFFKDQAKREPRSLSYILHFQTPGSWSIENAQAFLEARVQQELGYPVKLCVTGNKKNSGHAFVVCEKHV